MYIGRLHTSATPPHPPHPTHRARSGPDSREVVSLRPTPQLERRPSDPEAKPQRCRRGLGAGDLWAGKCAALNLPSPSQGPHLPPPPPPNPPMSTSPPPHLNPTPNPPPPPAPRPALPALPSVPRAGMTSARQGLRRHCGSSCSLCRSSRLQCERCATRCYWRARSHSRIEDATSAGRGGGELRALPSSLTCVFVIGPL